MLFRFCLYGFLKNQQYYEAFIILAFREKGLSFAMIGLLIGFRELAINLLEVPTGAMADVVGRRRSMVFSFLAYIGAFLVFGLSSALWMLFVAMFMFSIGEAFRTGTHKAIIFDWLAREGRGAEKTRIYGQTRSWSKMGSAVSVVIAAVLVFRLGNYSCIFLSCIFPYVLNIVNMLSYPAYLDGPRKRAADGQGVVATLLMGLRDSMHDPGLRRLLAESMVFEGCHKVSKDYLQPLLKTAALSLPLLLGLADRQRTAMLVGAVYMALYVLSSFASRHADVLVRRAGSEERGALLLWAMNGAAFVVLLAGILSGLIAAAIAAFVALTVLQNFWRPILIGRVASRTDESRMATVLSVESQAKTLFAAVAAPVLGLAVDLVPRACGVTHWRLAPVGVLGVAVCAGMLCAQRRR